MIKRRTFLKQTGMATLAVSMFALDACQSKEQKSEGTEGKTDSKDAPKERMITELVSESLGKEMHDKALEIAKKNIKGSEASPFFKKPYLDAAFSKNIFLWDSCFMAAYAKYFMKELPIAQALDNFYMVQGADGFICREHFEDGKPYWNKQHPVSINPPLLAFAELELYSQSEDKDRLKMVYPKIKRNYEFLQKNYLQADGLYFADALGMGMDNVVRHPRDWKDDKKGIAYKKIDPKIDYNSLQSFWNKQGRLVDFSSQMALLALNLKSIAGLIGQYDDLKKYETDYEALKTAINTKCWSEEDGFYFDLGYDKQIKRWHVGMYWALMAEIVPADKIDRFVFHLTDPKKFGTPVAIPTLSKDDPEYRAEGNYWLGGVWAPTTYMILRALQTAKKMDLAKKLAASFYDSVAQTYIDTKTFWEYYSPEKRVPGSFSQDYHEEVHRGKRGRDNFCGWTALAPISIYKEFILG
ncbi:MAG: hypothetical protein EAZ97_10740 [Bacteroidetes bacterium]|nr:MAG: hypothetical protein EAZ97_10740 [Bacteroidota bacterium]